MLKIVKEVIRMTFANAVGLTVVNVCTVMDLLRWIVIYPLNQEVDVNYFTDIVTNMLERNSEES